MHFDSETLLSICGMLVVCEIVIGGLQVFIFTKNVYACGIHKHNPGEYRDLRVLVPPRLPRLQLPSQDVPL